MELTAWQLAAAVGQCVSCLLLTGVALVVQAVVYPGLITAGRVAPDSWPAVHGAHTRRITYAVGPPWLVQGVTCALLLWPPARPPGVPLAAVLAAGALGLLTVASTVAWAVPLHQRLTAGYDDDTAVRLLHANLARLIVWAAAAGLSVAILLGW